MRLSIKVRPLMNSKKNYIEMNLVLHAYQQTEIDFIQG